MFRDVTELLFWISQAGKHRSHSRQLTDSALCSESGSNFWNVVFTDFNKLTKEELFFVRRLCKSVIGLFYATKLNKNNFFFFKNFRVCPAASSTRQQQKCGKRCSSCARPAVGIVFLIKPNKTKTNMLKTLKCFRRPVYSSPWKR